MIFRRKSGKNRAESSTDDAAATSSADETGAVVDSDATTATADDPGSTDDTGSTDVDSAAPAAAAEPEATRVVSRDAGPFDSAEVAIEPGDQSRIDLGSLLIGMSEGMQLTLQVDDEQQEVIAALLIQDDSALEVRAFAAPKRNGIWDEVREEMVVEAERMGGTVTQNSGPFGDELLADVPMSDPEGNQFEQRSRVVGVDGPRWFLRGTILGRAAEPGEDDAAVLMENAFRNVIVVRGDEPMAPREALPLTMPEMEPDEVYSPDGPEGSPQP